MGEYAVTTMDNPWNPFTEYEKWQDWDNKNGYTTNEWLALYALTSSSLDDETNEQIAANGINDFLAFNPFGIHFKVYKDEADKLIPLANEAYLKMMEAKTAKDTTAS